MLPQREGGRCRDEIHVLLGHAIHGLNEVRIQQPDAMICDLSDVNAGKTLSNYVIE